MEQGFGIAILLDAEVGAEAEKSASLEDEHRRR